MSLFKTVKLNHTLSVHVLPIFSDNYCYFLVNNKTNQFALVDPADPKTVEQHINTNDYLSSKKLSCILTTHKHWDHAGGNKHFLENDASLQIFGGSDSEGVNQVVWKSSSDDHQEKTFSIFDDKTNITAYHTPCHTSGHLCYVVKTDGPSDCIFTGDTFFIGGCGKFFEGSAQQMLNNVKLVNDKICGSDEHKMKRMLMFCGHEYTVKNMQFIIDRVSDSEVVKQYLQKYKKQLDDKDYTVPSTIYDENQYNPYFKAANTLPSSFFEKMDPTHTLVDSVELVKHIREMKDS